MARGKFKHEEVRNAMKTTFEQNKNSFAEGDYFSKTISMILDKSFYEVLNGSPENWDFPKCSFKTDMEWQIFKNLPTGLQGKEDLYRANERMQNLLCSEHTMKHTVGFLMLRQDRYTGLYIGAASNEGGKGITKQVRENVQTNLTGARLEKVENAKRTDKNYTDSVEYKLNRFTHWGVVTGQPSLRKDDNNNPIQTLDKLTGGILDHVDGSERDYAVLALSEPVPDADIKELIENMQSLKSSLHDYASYTESMSLTEGGSEGQSRSRSISPSAGVVFLALTAASLFTGGVSAALAGSIASSTVFEGMGSALSLGLSHNRGKFNNRNASLTKGISREHVNYMIKYCETLIDKAIARLEKGRNLGFWNTGIYVLGDSEQTVGLVMAELRSIYSGEETYQEPIRTFNFKTSQDVKQYVKDLQLLPLPVNKELTDYIADLADDDSWHIFGRLYEYMATPLNTEELSIVMSLPKKDVPGIHIKKDAVEFATNPPSNTHNKRTIELGEILDMGAATGHLYKLDLDQLNRHGLIVGLNGGGKSVTSKSILNGMIKNNIPFMVIDPVKTDYVYWADSYNKKHSGDEGFKPIKIYAPGLKRIYGVDTPVSKLEMNPFRPYAAEGAPLNIQGHIDSLLGLLNKTMAMGDFLPMLMEETVYSYMECAMGKAIASNSEADPMEVEEIGFPTIRGMLPMVDRILKERNYSEENTRNFRAAIETRINTLTRGWKKDFFETSNSTPPEELFENNAVICLAGVSSNSDKSFFMSLLLQAANEYRISKYQYDEKYHNTVNLGRKMYGGNYLAHYTVVEEAHRILQVPRGMVSDADPQAAAAEKFCEMLSEIRESGEGLMIIDQYPSRLIADAIKNTNLKLIHRLQAIDDRTAMAGCMSLNDEQSLLLASLKKGDAVIGSEQDDSAMWLHVLLPEGL